MADTSKRPWEFLSHSETDANVSNDAQNVEKVGSICHFSHVVATFSPFGMKLLGKSE
jgi:hypothetical protein